jgi:hypothetical protein
MHMRGNGLYIVIIYAKNSLIIKTNIRKHHAAFLDKYVFQLQSMIL